MNPEEYDYHLKPDSACINTGKNEAPDLAETDLEGDSRIVDVKVIWGRINSRRLRKSHQLQASLPVQLPGFEVRRLGKHLP